MQTRHLRYRAGIVRFLTLALVLSTGAQSSVFVYGQKGIYQRKGMIEKVAGETGLLTVTRPDVSADTLMTEPGRTAGASTARSTDQTWNQAR